ncbi:MAG TPA: PKD domain-containing protein [Terriglobales bacterium]|nr:PKD domain-containing protein [Terriglobales bacterium]
MDQLSSVVWKTVRIAIVALSLVTASAAQQLKTAHLSATINRNGTYELSVLGQQPILSSDVAAQVDQHWVRSGGYPRKSSSESEFEDELGPGRQIVVTFTGLRGEPDLLYTLRLYRQSAYGTIQVSVRNSTGKELTVQAIRSVDANRSPVIDLGGNVASDRVLSDSFSEDWPNLKIYDLGRAPAGLHPAVGSQLIYNRDTSQSFFIGALTSDRLLSVLRLKTDSAAKPNITSYTADSTGTTEIQKDFDFKNSPPEDQVELSLPLKPGEELASEKLLFSAGADYHEQLLAYGDAIRRLHHARVSAETPMGWWSWTAYYAAINEGETLVNAQWQSEHLKQLGYKFFQIDDGYEYARGEFTATNATQFPDGMGYVTHRIVADGLTLGIWTAPFEVSARAWVYEHHKDWLVHNAKGEPIPIGAVWNQKTDVLYALDTTNPGAQEYLRQTYRTLVREWGVRFIKLDFMDTTAIEGYFYKPHSTALEAQRMGLQIIRDAVGDEVLLDKDGSPMLNPVGLVDTGRISVDTGHNFQRTKTAAPGIAARFYMNRNFFVDDPDAFNVTDTYVMREPQPPVSLAAAQASIALSAISGGMFEIGDDMPLLGSEKDRLALVENQDLISMARIGRASRPLDLMTYAQGDEQPSVFFLREDDRQAILTVFNWTKGPRSHSLKLSDLGFRGDHSVTLTDVLNEGVAVAVSGGVVQLENQSPESVKMIKIVDASLPASSPMVTAQVPERVAAGETIKLSAQASPDGVPAIAYHWDFGDGTTAEGANVSHAFTREAEMTVRLRVPGIDGVSAEKQFTVRVSGHLGVLPELKENRRLVEP